MRDAYICDYIRTPIGRFSGQLSSIRTDDLASIPLKELIKRNPKIDWEAVDEVVLGCANQAGEDNRNVARMASLLAGLPETVPGVTVNRLCGSGMNAIIDAARAVKAGECELVMAGGVEGMSRSPNIIPKADTAFSRTPEIFDSTIGWRFINPKFDEIFGTESMPETAENVAEDFNISRADQDLFALRSQEKAAAAQKNKRLAKEICGVNVPQKKSEDLLVTEDEHPRQTSLEKLSSLSTPFRNNGTVTAGNASGINDGAAALIIASEYAINNYGLKPIARILGGASAGTAPRVMGVGPVPATQKLCRLLDLNLDDIDIFELNEAFASQVLAVIRELGLDEKSTLINPNGGAIALGHPLGMSGARITGTLALELKERKSRYGLASMCVGVGQGISIALERV